MTPMTDEEIAHRAADGMTADEVREALDVDAWFAACDVTDLDPDAVAVLVRFALRDSIRDTLMVSLMRGDRDALPDEVLGLLFTRQSDIAEHVRAVQALLAELRAVNEP